MDESEIVQVLEACYLQEASQNLKPALNDTVRAEIKQLTALLLQVDFFSSSSLQITPRIHISL